LLDIDADSVHFLFQTRASVRSIR